MSGTTRQSIPFAGERPDSARYFEGKNVLVTGGLGFIGSNLAIRLANAGAAVTVVDSLDPGCGGDPINLTPAASQIKIIEADIRDTDSFAEDISRADVIFNLAGEISHSRSMKEPERDLALNTFAQLQFLLACRTYRPGVRIIYASTRQVYGRPSYLPVDEAHSIQPVDFNGIHKYAATQYHLLLTDRGELDAVILRLSNVYGPRMALHLPQQGFLGVYLRCALQGLPLQVYGDGMQLRDPVHVDDAVEAFVLAGTALNPASRVFNIGGPEPLPLRQIAGIFSHHGKRADVRVAPFPKALRQMDIGSYSSDTQRARRELNWTPRIRLDAGVRGTIEWFRQNTGLFESNPVPVPNQACVPA